MSLGLRRRLDTKLPSHWQPLSLCVCQYDFGIGGTPLGDGYEQIFFCGFCLALACLLRRFAMGGM